MYALHDGVTYGRFLLSKNGPRLHKEILENGECNDVRL